MARRKPQLRLGARRRALPARAGRCGTRGFTIAEILAALLVIAVGVIGIAALYSEQAHTNPDTRLRRQAAELAAAIAARILDTDKGLAGFATTIGVLCKPGSRPRLPLDAAAREAACWEDEVAQALPSGLGTITRDTSTTPVSYVIAVSWSAPGSGAASYVLRVQPEAVPPPPDAPAAQRAAIR